MAKVALVLLVEILEVAMGVVTTAAEELAREGVAASKLARFAACATFALSRSPREKEKKNTGICG